MMDLIGYISLLTGLFVTPIFLWVCITERDEAWF